MSEKSYKLLIKIINKSDKLNFFLLAAHVLAVIAVLQSALGAPASFALVLAVSGSAWHWYGLLVRNGGQLAYLSFLSCERCRYRFADADWQRGAIVSASRVFGMVLLNIKPETGGSLLTLLLCRATVGSQQLRQLKIWLAAC